MEDLVHLHPSDQRLAPLIQTLPKEIQYLILSSFATRSFDHLKCVSNLNSQYNILFSPKLYRSIELDGDKVNSCLPILWSIDAIGRQHISDSDTTCSLPTNADCVYRERHKRFDIIAGSTRKLIISHSEVIKALARILRKSENHNLFSRVEELAIRQTRDDTTPKLQAQNIMHHPNSSAISTIVDKLSPQKVCLDLGLPFAITWRKIVHKIGDQICARDSKIKELSHHGAPISNLEVKLVIIDGIEIQRFYLEDYIAPSIGQTSLRIFYELGNPPSGRSRTWPREIHVYASWPANRGLPLELADSNIPGMAYLRRVTVLHDFGHGHLCEICS
ncbi:uncharacterized protein I303_104975 [Kwoniella dejecticola CBS 10117]|uniref:F-box domain-containing protein n=1 Tax=Kwoniella dejecticola CBS 10117 TaxID=1296121 RepID=A0A1A6A3U7_9TREE|nr:uncharacterized protein I303_05580 [Kwoniella dejecticola CBS 10117]OBR84721.1 hypothetical protein I303_05580 [Kwoniella dejecticola CBS 10117]